MFSIPNMKTLEYLYFFVVDICSNQSVIARH